MKKIIISFLILISIAGCWNYKELNDYSIVTGVALDKDGKDYEISVLISNSTKNNSDSSATQSQIVVYSGRGNTIYDAFKDIGLISPKELYLGHFSVLVLSEDIAKEGITNILDMFLREASVKKNFYVVLAKGDKAKDTLKIMSPLSDFPSQNITDNLISTTKLQSLISNINFNDLLSKIINNGIEPTISSIKVIGNQKKGSNKDNIENSSPKAYIKLDTLGIFKNNKLVKWATKDESVGINIINNKINEMYLETNYNNSKIVLDTTEFSTNVEVVLKNNKPIVNINSIGEAKIMEVNGDININSNKTMNIIRKKANNQIKKYIQDGINIAVKNKTDIFGIGLKYNQEYPKYYNKKKNKWNENLNSIKFNIKSNLTIKSIGSSENSLEEMNEKK